MIDIVNTVSSIIDLAKKVKAASEAIKDSESKLLMADLISQLANLKIEAANLTSENQELRDKVKYLEKQKAESPTLVGDVYMVANNGPFCTTCWDTKNQRVRLKEEIKDFQSITGHKYICPACQSRHKGRS